MLSNIAFSADDLVTQRDTLKARYNVSCDAKDKGIHHVDTLQIKCQLAETCYQLGEQYAAQKSYLEAVKNYYLACVSTRHEKSWQLFAKKNNDFQTLDDAISPSVDVNDENAFFYGLQYLTGLGVKQNDEQGCAYLQLAANRGEAAAQFFLGRMHTEGRAGIAQGRTADTEAMQWFQRAAEQGLASAQFNLGCLYEQGRAGIAQGPTADAEAIQWFQRAAEQGLASAQFNLGYLYEQGRAGIAQCQTADIEAVKWYQRAAEQGLGNAQSNLGWMYEQGRAGIAQGPTADIEAIKWYQRAAEQDNSRAKTNLDILYSRQRDKESDACLAVENFYFCWSVAKNDMKQAFRLPHAVQHFVNYCNLVIDQMLFPVCDEAKINKSLKVIESCTPVKNWILSGYTLFGNTISVRDNELIKYTQKRVAAYVHLNNSNNKLCLEIFLNIPDQHLIGDDLLHIAMLSRELAESLPADLPEKILYDIKYQQSLRTYKDGQLLSLFFNEDGTFRTLLHPGETIGARC